MALQNTKTPAMILHEFTVKHVYSPPKYILLRMKIGMPPDKFHYEVNVANVYAWGFGRSKQFARQDAAKKALELLAERGLYDANANQSPESKKPVNYIGFLRKLCRKHRLPPLVFYAVSLSGPVNCLKFTYGCKIASMTTQGIADTKKKAKQLAARKMIDKLKDIDPELNRLDEAASNVSTETDGNVSGRDQVASILDETSTKATAIDDLIKIIKKKIMEVNIKFEDFYEQFQMRNKKRLEYIFNALEIKYKIDMFQESNQHFAVALFDVETPIIIRAVGNTRKSAELNLINKIYYALDLCNNFDL